MWLSVGKVTKCLSHAVQFCDMLQDVPPVPATLALGQWVSSGYSFPEGRSSTTTENLPYLSELLICVLICGFSNYWLAMLLTSNYFFHKTRVSKICNDWYESHNTMSSGKVCFCRQDTPHNSFNSVWSPHCEPGTIPEKDMGERGQAIIAGRSVHINLGNHLMGAQVNKLSLTFCSFIDVYVTN